jgi:hypothetical protein
MSRTFYTLYGLFWALVLLYGTGPNVGLTLSLVCLISVILMHAGVLRDLNRSAYATVATLVNVYTVVLITGSYDLITQPLPTWMYWTTWAITATAALLLCFIGLFAAAALLRLGDAHNVWASMKTAIEGDKSTEDLIDS